jgi:hypothetical protein
MKDPLRVNLIYPDCTTPFFGEQVIKISFAFSGELGYTFGIDVIFGGKPWLF